MAPRLGEQRSLVTILAMDPSPRIDLARPLKKSHLSPGCAKQAFRIAALDRCGNHFRSIGSRSKVLPKYTDTRRFLARRSAELRRSLAPGTFLTGLRTGFFNTLFRLSGLKVEKLDDVSCRHLVCLLFRDAGKVPFQEVH